MDIIKDNELIYVNDTKKGINSCGYNVNCLLFNSGMSPIFTMNNKTNKIDTNSKASISSLFENLVVPNWALHYEPNNSKINSKIEDNSTFEIIDDNLYDKLLDLAIYKDPIIDNNNNNNNNNKQHKKHNKTKNKFKKYKDTSITNSNSKIKHKKTRKK